MRFCVLYGSVRETRKGIRLAKYLCKQLELRGHHVDFIDAMEQNLPMLNNRYIDYTPGQVPDQIEQLSETLKAADGFVFITGEYNHSIQPGLKNILDHFGPAQYGFKPAAIASYSAGDFGGVRASEQILPILLALKMTTTSAQLVTPRIDQQYNENGHPQDPSIDERANSFLNNLEWYADALKAGREKGLPK